MCVCVGGMFRVLTLLRVTCALAGTWLQSFLEDQGRAIKTKQGLCPAAMGLVSAAPKSPCLAKEPGLWKLSRLRRTVVGPCQL